MDFYPLTHVSRYIFIYLNFKVIATFSDDYPDTTETKIDPNYKIYN